MTYFSSFILVHLLLYHADIYINLQLTLLLQLCYISFTMLVLKYYWLYAVDEIHFMLV